MMEEQEGFEHTKIEMQLEQHSVRYFGLSFDPVCNKYSYFGLQSEKRMPPEVKNEDVKIKHIRHTHTAHMA